MKGNCSMCNFNHIVKPTRTLPPNRCYCECHSYKVDEFGKRQINNIGFSNITAIRKREAVICPICHGSGIGYNIPKGITWSGSPSDKWKVPCHGCSGKGWVVI